MITTFTYSPDGTKIAYECVGTGPAIILLHGGGVTRHDWHEAGYVDHLSDIFTVITMDLRGHGESGHPTDPSAYTTEKWGQDILTVADACDIETFIMWCMSFGGKVGRYLAVESEQVSKFIMMGTPLGPGVSGKRRQEALDFIEHWSPIIQAQREGTLNLEALPDDDCELLQRLNVPVMLGWVSAMLEWPAVGPKDFPCPTLWVVGSEDSYAKESSRQYEGDLQAVNFRTQFLDGLDHDQVFDKFDKVFPTLIKFSVS